MKEHDRNIGIQIGASDAAVARAEAAIMDILRCEFADQSTKVEALLTLRTVCKVEHTTISNCTIYGGEKQ